MTDFTRLFELAVAASNFSERTAIVQRLIARPASKADPAELDDMERWMINTSAAKLSLQMRNESLRRPGVKAMSEDEVKLLLTDFSLYAKDAKQADASQQAEFLRPHQRWLPTYEKALSAMSLPEERFSQCVWREDRCYYGSFGKVCEPFLRLLHEELQLVAAGLESKARHPRISRQVYGDLELHLLSRFELALAWALQTEISVYCTERNINKAKSDSREFIAYLNESFSDAESYHTFFLNYPVLGRWLSQVAAFVQTVGSELICRLVDDAQSLSTCFWRGVSVSELKSLRFSNSDFHAGGRSVVLVDVELADQQTQTIVYKPRCIASEAAFQQLLDELSTVTPVAFGSNAVLCRSGYGYARLIPADQTSVQEASEVDRYFNQLGGFLALFYVLGGSDLHFENILVADGDAFVCDCETLFSVVPKGMPELPETLGDSVYRTGMLQWPRREGSETIRDWNISAYSGGESYEIPFAVPRISAERMSLGLRVEHKAGITVESKAANRIRYQGQIVDPEPYKSSIVDGFNHIYNWFQRNPDAVHQRIAELFADVTARFINWGTQAYSHLLVACRHPKCLVNPLEVDLLFNTLRMHRRQWDNGQFVECELRALWDLDVPVFSAKADSKSLLYRYEDELPDVLERSALEHAQHRIQQVSTENRIRQVQYLSASLSADEVQNPDFVEAAVDFAHQLGQKLCVMMQPGAGAPWRTFELATDGSTRETDAGVDLYHGTSGIGLFLAYLDAISPDSAIRAAAERALTYSLDRCDVNTIGAFQGTGSVIYLLTHLSQLWNDVTLLDLALELAAKLSPAISRDQHFDVLSGAAGVLAVLLGLSDLTDGEALGGARQCADHLLLHARNKDGALSWPTLGPAEASDHVTGFAHGTAGIGWSLIACGARTNNASYIQAGRQAFAYDALHFDPVERDWYDLRTSVRPKDPTKRHFSNAWCNGAAGIGLSRIAAWDMLGRDDKELLRDAYTALAATVRNFHKLGADSLCHGRSGNSELLLRMALLRDEPSLQMEAVIQGQAQWRRFENSSNWIGASGGMDVFPGLMLGLSGLGMHFLRLAHPDRVPSPLLLDPPVESSLINDRLASNQFVTPLAVDSTSET